MSPIFDFIFWIAGGILGMTFVGYPLLTSLLSSGKKIKRTNSLPKITVIIPTLNEEKNIGRKLKEVLRQYQKNKMTVIVADSQSTDNTLKIAKTFPVKIIKTKVGKIRALNTALKNVKTEIVVVTDADAILGKNAIKKTISCFSGDIGAVNGFVKELKSDLIYSDSKSKYHEKDWNSRYKEGLIDTCCSLDGKLMAFRTHIVKQLPPSSVADDFELTFLLRKLGYRCIVDKETVVFEKPPSSLKNDIEQMRRRSKLSIITAFRYVKMLFNPKYGYFGVFTFPFRRFFALLTPVLLIPVSLYLLFNWAILTILFSFSFLIFLFIAKKYYHLILLYAVFLAWIDVLTGNIKKGGVWKKIS